MHGDYEWQLDRWRRLKLTAAQRREVERLAGQLAPLAELIDQVLELAAELRARHDRPDHAQIRPAAPGRCGPAMHISCASLR